MLARFFIGANNDTKRVETEKVVSVLSARFDAFTVSPSSGYWKGTPEESVVVEVASEIDHDWKAIAKELATTLKQEAVGLVVMPHNIDLIS